MSMISAQCDELRNAADELDERAKAYAPSGRNVLSPMLRSAAETIWELRCKLVGMGDQQDEIERIIDENARLRSCLSDDAENARQIMAENAKLREYVRMLTKATVYGPCEWCQHDSDGTCGTETEPMRNGCRLYEGMRELGIEVDA